MVGAGMAQTMDKRRWIIAVGLAGGTLLAVIGIRYLWVPESAARTFGVSGRPTGHELYYIIGLRNLWLGLLAVGFALWREWRALQLWFATGMIVCFADASIAATSTGHVPQVIFHVTCGVVCAALTAALARVTGRGDIG
jgi:hypothetical protein